MKRRVSGKVRYDDGAGIDALTLAFPALPEASESEWLPGLEANEVGLLRALTAEQESDQVLIRVKDTGIGISAEMLPRTFEMFTKADRSLERSQGGLGIGLTLVQRLVEMHRGTVEAHSTGPGKGSEFVLHFPVAVEVRKKAARGRRLRPAGHCAFQVPHSSSG